MADTYVSKIQLRRGLQNELPGEPSNGSMTSGLATAEMAFAIDTGRVFIGIDETQGGNTLGRTTFPYNNIEVLTENSSELLQSFFDNYTSNMKTNYIVSDSFYISSNKNDWKNVTVTNNNISSPLIIQDATETVCAQITYFLYSNNNIVQTGKLMIISDGNSLEPTVTDQHINYDRTDLNAEISNNNPELIDGSIQFSAKYTNNGIILQYLNLMTYSMNMYFRIEQPSFS